MQTREVSVLEYLVRCYFHEDYDREGESPIDVVKKFADEEPSGFSRELLSELESLKHKGLTEEGARRLWLEQCGAMYEPDRKGGISYLQWFEQMRNVVKQRLDRES
ncbi:contact-dependent growth inhibition system immunity protein [Amycolatopsis sp. NPDC049868]|uniref:contact-dependent growth inhibition system immunity protein n=1 Tax=Amycolatopsis sp. NPDC049868 TaxID=3363934 RepID=UPI0037A07E18